ncbi:MAG: potassium transporter TrkG [Candidatus Aenigmatarchaeota archaeon]
MKPLLANLGFVLQFAGFFVLIPIISAFYLNETEALTPLFITSVSLLVTGFFLNALCERKVLSFKASCLLLFLVFSILPLFTSIPCQYLDPLKIPNQVEKFTVCYFESVSTSTTTGLTLMKNVSLSKSLVLYRSVIQWVGGIGLIFILLSFFYPSDFADRISKLIDIERITEKIKKSFVIVVLVYAILTAIFIAIFFVLGYGDLIDSSSLILSTIVTGSLPIQTIPDSLLLKALLMVVMIIGATNFWVVYRLFYLRMKKPLAMEFEVFILIILIATFFVFVFSNLDLFSSLFHVVSTSSTTGLSYVDFNQIASPSFSQPLKMVFIALMFIGGCSFSSAGGIKIKRLILLFKSVPVVIKRELTKKSEKVFYEGNEITDSDLMKHLLTIILSIFLIFISAFIFTFYGFSFGDSIFETLSAFSTAGISVGITSPSLALELKWLLIILMIVGRVEIMTLLMGISGIKED